MLTYILRRLLLMVPTLIGITFMIFMLVALSPGGVGAALRVAGGGATEATNRAVQEAYLEDRYGLDDPVVMQYLRWLGRISPVKFGARAQVAPTGEVVSPPRPVKQPFAWRLFGEALPAPPAGAEAPWAAGAGEDERHRAFQRLNNRYAQDRAAFVSANALLREELGVYVRAVGREDVLRDADVDEARVVRLTPDRAAPAWAPVASAWERARGAYERALASRADLARAFEARPYRQAGVGLVPGVLSVAPPDLGTSFARGRPVADLIANALPVTIMINLIAIPFIYAIAVPSGIVAATRAGSTFDYASGLAFVALWSVPTVWAGVLAVGFLANNEYLGAFPVAGLSAREAEAMTFLPALVETTLPDGTVGEVWQRGWLLDRLWHVCLPVLCLVYYGFAVLSKQTRAAMLDNFNMDYVRTAKAKGVAQRDIVLAHVFRNSLLPLITIFASVFPAMLAGSVVIERIFTVPGMGSLIIEAINLKDRELILANATIIAVVNILALLLADILYAVADPRISYK